MKGNKCPLKDSTEHRQVSKRAALGVSQNIGPHKECPRLPSVYGEDKRVSKKRLRGTVYKEAFEPQLRQGVMFRKVVACLGKRQTQGKLGGFLSPKIQIPPGEAEGLWISPPNTSKAHPARKAPAPQCAPGQVGASPCGGLPKAQGAGRQSCLLPPTPSRGAQAALRPTHARIPKKKELHQPWSRAGADRCQVLALRLGEGKRSRRGWVTWVPGSARRRPGLHRCPRLGKRPGHGFSGEVSPSPQPLTTGRMEPFHSQSTIARPQGCCAGTRTRGLARKRKLQRTRLPSVLSFSSRCSQTFSALLQESKNVLTFHPSSETAPIKLKGAAPSQALKSRSLFNYFLPEMKRGRGGVCVGGEGVPGDGRRWGLWRGGRVQSKEEGGLTDKPENRGRPFRETHSLPRKCRQI